MAQLSGTFWGSVSLTCELEEPGIKQRPNRLPEPQPPHESSPHCHFGISNRQLISTSARIFANYQILFMLEPLKFGITSIRYYILAAGKENIHVYTLGDCPNHPFSTFLSIFKGQKLKIWHLLVPCNHLYLLYPTKLHGSHVVWKAAGPKVSCPI